MTWTGLLCNCGVHDEVNGFREHLVRLIAIRNISKRRSDGPEPSRATPDDLSRRIRFLCSICLLHLVPIAHIVELLSNSLVPRSGFSLLSLKLHSLALISISPHKKKKSQKMESKTLAPPWIESLLSTDFFAVCRVHGDAARSECNMFCLDCNVGAFCFYCRSSKHKDHRVVQIRRSSYHDVVRVAEIENVIDINGVQTYVINSARVMFLNERPLPKVGKAASHICDICGRSLLDSCRFCSLGCKLVGIKRKGDTTFVKDGNSNDNEEKKQREEGKSRRISSIRDHDLDEQEKISEGTKHSSIYTLKSLPSSISISTNTNYTRRSRKGIPRRAPFGT